MQSLSNYSSVCRLKKVLARMLGNQMTKADHKALQDQFNQMDENGDGKVNLEELTEYIYKRGGSREQAQKAASNIIRQLDQDNNGAITLAEWQDARLSTKFQDDDLVKESFKRIDQNNDGFICHEELFKLFNGQLNHQLVKQMIAEIDQTNDGRISYDEFVTAMQKGLLKSVLSPRVHMKKTNDI